MAKQAEKLCQCVDSQSGLFHSNQKSDFSSVLFPCSCYFLPWTALPGKCKMAEKLITAIHRFPGLHKCLLKDSGNFFFPKSMVKISFFLVLIAATKLVLAGEICMPLKCQFYEKKNIKIHDLPVQNCGWVRLLRRRNQSLLHSPQSARMEPIINPAAHTVKAQPIPHKAHLRQVSQLRSLPPQLIKDAAVETLLLLTAAAQFSQVWIIQTGPVLREGLSTVPLDLPARKQRFESKSNMQE